MSIEKYIVTFKNRFFKNTDCEDYWVSGVPGGIFYINGYYFLFDDIKYSIDNKVTTKELFNWYNSVKSVLKQDISSPYSSLQDWLGISKQQKKAQYS